METRPKGVLIVAVVVFIAALLALIVGLTIFIPGTPLDMIWTLKNSFPTGFRSSSTRDNIWIFYSHPRFNIIISGMGIIKRNEMGMVDSSNCIFS